MTTVHPSWCALPKPHSGGCQDAEQAIADWAPVEEPAPAPDDAAALAAAQDAWRRWSMPSGGFTREAYPTLREAFEAGYLAALPVHPPAPDQTLQPQEYQRVFAHSPAPLPLDVEIDRLAFALEARDVQRGGSPHITPRNRFYREEAAALFALMPPSLATPEPADG